MDSILTNSKTYFTTVVNKLEEINTKYNYGIVQLVNQDRNFKIGPLDTTQSQDCNIYGSPFNIEEKLEQLFNQVYSDIDSGSNPIIAELSNLNFSPDTTIKIVKNNMKVYISTNVNQTMSSDITVVLTDILNFEQTFIQNIRKVNLVVKQHDGKIDTTNLPSIYTLTSTTEVSQTSTGVGDTLVELDKDLIAFGGEMKNFNTYLEKEQIITNSYDSVGKIQTFKINSSNIINNCFFMVIGRIFSQDSKKDEFIDACLINVSDINEPYSLENKLKKIVNDLAKDYSKEIEKDEEFFQEFKQKDEYKNYVNGVEELMYKSGKTRKFTFSTVTPSDDEVKKQFKELYDNQNHGEVNTYLGKVKLTS